MKKIIAYILIGALAVSFSACNGVSNPKESLTYETRPSDTVNIMESTTESASSLPQVQPEKPIAPSTWEYPAIDLSKGKYTAEKLDFDACARSFGYQSGTYEYEYFRALSGISFYARIASNHVSNAVKNYTVSDLAEGFYKTVSRETFIAPYENILFHTFSLLKNSDFTLFPNDDALIEQYQNTLSYLLDKPVEIWYPCALSFTDIDTKLTEYASALLKLKEKYPDYTGEFKLSAQAASKAQALIESCKIVAENRSEQWMAWEVYFKEVTPAVATQAELISEKDTVKITFTSDHPLSVSIDPKYIADFKGEIIETGNTVGYLYDPMESPVVCYIPIGLFYQNQGVFQVTKYASVEPMRYYKENIKVHIDVSACFSDEAITLSDPFLDAVLKEEFGGAYSEKDLSQISWISVWYYPTEEKSFQSGVTIKSEPTIEIHYYNRTLGDDPIYGSFHRYSDYFQEGWQGDFPMEILNDMAYFPLLETAQFFRRGKENKVPLSEEYLDRILTQKYTAKDFEP